MKKKTNDDNETDLHYNRERTHLTAIAFLAQDYSLGDIAPPKLAITASREAWQNLERLYLEHPDLFHVEMYGQFIRPAITELTVKKPRGKYKVQSRITSVVSGDAAWLYGFFTYWSKLPAKQWPDYLVKLIKLAESQDYASFVRKPSGRYDALGLTMFAIQTAYEKSMKKYQLESPYNQDSFYRTYILKGEVPSFKGMSPRAVAQSVVLSRHNRVLRKLKVL